MSTRPFISTLLALTLLTSAAAQSETPATETPPAVTVAGSEPTEGSATRDRDTLSVDFPDEEIRNILRNVADLFELNLVVPDTLAGRTSIKLRDVTWRQIFQVVLSPAGYTYIEEGNIIKVVSQESLSMEPVATEVFILNNAKAQDIKPTVDGLVDANAGGKILIDSRSNALVITERPSRMTRIRVIIEQLDKATAQVMIESKFVEVTDSDIRNIGVNWASLSGMSLGARNLNQSWQKESGITRENSTSNTSGTGSNRNTVNGTTGSTTNANNTTNSFQYDVIPPVGPNGAFTGTNPVTMNIQNGTVTGLPTNVSGNLSASNFEPAVPGTVGPPATPGTPATFTSPFNSNASSSTGATSGTSLNDTLTNTANAAVNNLLGLTGTSSQSRLASAVFSASDFNIIISALKTQNDTKVVSNPTVVTLNNTEATINIGSEFPIPSYTYNAERGTFEVSGFQYKPIGVILKVTPQVNAQGTIRLNLEPEISSSTRETTFGGAGGASIPIIDTRKVKTQVSLKDGYTAGIGGLLSTSKSNTGTKVPVLGSVPLLGRLFSSKGVVDRTTNLLIFITAKTVNPDGAAPSDVFNAAALESAGVEQVPAGK
jgi:type II secretory pathway component GspD/PulD (secretin)